MPGKITRWNLKNLIRFFKQAKRCIVAAGSVQQYGLSQSDFENEIGNKSLVSRILSGRRSLTFDHMRALANRFQIPVSMFVD